MESLSEQSFLILAALADQPRHGYGLVTEVAKLSGNRVRLRASTLYAALERLSNRGLIEPDHDEVDSGRLRRFYRLTDNGATLVEAEIERMTSQARVAKRRLARRASTSVVQLGLTW
jgi:DNA-binding PadR family transcriptional regulator